jgi:hypothetical protein
MQGVSNLARRNQAKNILSTNQITTIKKNQYSRVLKLAEVPEFSAASFLFLSCAVFFAASFEF